MSAMYGTYAEAGKLTEEATLKRSNIYHGRKQTRTRLQECGIQDWFDKTTGLDIEGEMGAKSEIF